MTVRYNPDWILTLEEQWRLYRDGNEEALEPVMGTLIDFCVRVASRTCGVYIYPDDEEASIAQLALWEAIQKYDPDKGSLLMYIGKVVRNRVIDYRRKLSTQRRFFTASFNPQVMEQALPSQVEEIVDEIARNQEIHNLSQELQYFGIAFSELPGVSPRQNRTRKQALEAAGYIASDMELEDYLKRKKMLPIVMLEDRYRVNRKILDRYRKYIVAAAMILIGDYAYLRGYLHTEKRDDE